MPLEKVEAVPDGLRDGFLRIALDDLLSVNLTHLVSGLDEDYSAEIHQCGTVTSIMGYTEWVGQAPDATISLGWNRNLEALATVIDAMPWSDQTKRAIQLR